MELEDRSVRENFPQTGDAYGRRFNRVRHEEKLQEVASCKRVYQHIVQAACEEFSLTREAFHSRRQDRAVTTPRKIVAWLLRNHPSAQFSFPIIAEVMGRDHSTILYACREIRDAIKLKRRELPRIQRICNRAALLGLKPFEIERAA